MTNPSNYESEFQNHQVCIFHFFYLNWYLWTGFHNHWTLLHNHMTYLINVFVILGHVYLITEQYYIRYMLKPHKISIVHKHNVLIWPNFSVRWFYLPPVIIILVTVWGYLGCKHSWWSATFMYVKLTDSSYCINCARERRWEKEKGVRETYREGKSERKGEECQQHNVKGTLKN